jgi:plastocyanin
VPPFRVGVAFWQQVHTVLIRPAPRTTAPRPLRVAAVTLAALLVLAACDAIGGAGGTPTPEGTPRPVATPRPTPLPTPPPGAVILEVRDRQFSTDLIEGVANVATIVYFTNHDEANHNLSIWRNASLDLELFHGDIFTGPDVTVVYEIPPLAAGTYYFNCSVTPSMHGVFIVR